MKPLPVRPIVLLITGLALLAVAASPASARGGGDIPRLDVLVTDLSGQALDSGGSATPFVLQLEGEPECPGDSAHDDFRVDSFMVPVDVDPATVKFNAIGPLPLNFTDYDEFRMPLVSTLNDGFAAGLTDLQFEPGGPGRIINVPAFHFANYVPTLGVEGHGLPSGSYRIGLACTIAGGEVTNLWETTIEIEQDPDDEPVGIVWRVTGPQPLDLEHSGPSNLPLKILLGVGGVAAVAAILLWWSSRDDDESEDENDPVESELDPV